MKKEDIFLIMPTNEEQNDFIIIVGRHLATKKHFKTKEEAEKYLDETHWDTILALIGETIEISKENDMKPTMINNGINKKEKK